MASIDDILPTDAADAVLLGRVWDSEAGGPRPVRIQGDEVRDLFGLARTMADLVEVEDVAERSASGPVRWSLSDLLEAGKDASAAHLLSPIDLQAIKACGVTFVASMVERVIEERCAGDASRAHGVREAVASALTDEVTSVVPGSAEAAKVREVLVAQGLWSQYLEVGLGPDPEVFTKAPVLSSVGYGHQIGIPAFSTWNNPEPELVLIVDSTGAIRGCTLGNDVNLRDVEGRSALLLGMAKDNNASAALGPFIRVFTDDFTLAAVQDAVISLRVEGADGYVLEGQSPMSGLSRTFERLVDATFGPHHQYPDGFALYTGTLFAPTQDRDVPGMGFTHKSGDRVSISSPRLGMLTNTVAPTEDLAPWTWGIRSLFSCLAGAEAGGRS